MMKSVIKIKGIVLNLLTLLLVISCNTQPKTTAGNETSTQNETTFKVTFIELGSVR